MTIVNDRNYTLETLCESGAILGKTCKVDDYKSWRRVAIAFRKSLQGGSYGSNLKLHGDMVYWLRRWINLDELEPIARGMATYDATFEPDPWRESYKDEIRFPKTPSIWPETTYNDITNELARYIKDGEKLFKQATAKGIKLKIGKELDRDPLEVSTTSKLGWVIPTALAAGALALGTWVYTSIVSARKGKPK